MTRLLSFILNGRGYGLKLTFLFTAAIGLAAALLSGLFLKDVAEKTEIHPLFQQLPTLHITAGQLADLAAPFEYTDAKSGLSLVINPLLPEAEAQADKTIYLLRDRVIMRLDGEAPITLSLPQGNITFDKERILKSLQTAATFVPIVMGVWLGILVFLGFLGTWGATLLLAPLVGRAYGPAVIGRAAAFSWGTLMLLDALMFLGGGAFSLSAAVLFATALSLILVRGLPPVFQ